MILNNLVGASSKKFLPKLKLGIKCNYYVQGFQGVLRETISANH